MVQASSRRGSAHARGALSRADAANRTGAREAFVALPAGYGAVHWQLAAESLDAWGQEQEHEHAGERLALEPEDLGLRTTYLAAGPSDPGIDLAIPFAVDR